MPCRSQALVLTPARTPLPRKAYEQRIRASSFAHTLIPCHHHIFFAFSLYSIRCTKASISHHLALKYLSFIHIAARINQKRYFLRKLIFILHIHMYSTLCNTIRTDTDIDKYSIYCTAHKMEAKFMFHCRQWRRVSEF